MTAETALYPPVKAFLEAQGYTVKGEVRGCDAVGVRDAQEPVIVELKRGFSLDLVLQGVDRLALSPHVYLAVGAWPRRQAAVTRLCRRLGLGLMVVRRGHVEVLADPTPYVPRRDRKETRRLLGEHARRRGDPSVGGATRLPVMTAYRQEALRCATLLETNGPMALAALRAAGDVPQAARILQRDVYGWFERTGRGIYALSADGLAALQRFGRMR